MVPAMANANIQSSYAKLVDIAEQQSTGKRVRRASDAPADAATALIQRQALRRQEQYARNAQDGNGWLNVIDSTLQTAQDYLSKAREVVVQAGNGTVDATARGALAEQVKNLRNSMIALANTSYGSRPVFGGLTTGNTAVTATGAPADQGRSYTTSGNYQITRPVAAGESIQVNLGLDEVFGTHDPLAGPTGSYSDADVFQVLERLASDLSSNNLSGLDSALSAIDGARGHIDVAQGVVGARQARLETVATRNATVTLDLEASVSDLEDVDIAKVAIDLSTQHMAYQAALSATTKVIQTSLVDFLR
jgi:flagellar hook-associated protein 3 FlgL